MKYRCLRITPVGPSMLKGMPRHGGTYWVPKRESARRILRSHLNCSSSPKDSHDKVIWIQTESKVSKPMLHMTSPNITAHTPSIRRAA